MTPELIKAYQEGSLSADEMYAVEKFLLENPFEAEALEGLETIAPNALSTHLDDLNARLETKLSVDKETKVIFWTMTRKMAASLLVLATAAFLFFLQEPDITTKELTQNDDKISETESKAPLDTLELVNGNRYAKALTSEADSDSEKKKEEEKSEATDLSNDKSGFIDFDKLEAKTETLADADPIVEIVEDKVFEPTEVIAESAAKSEVFGEAENQINQSSFDAKSKTLASASPLSAGTTITISDSMRTGLGKKSLNKTLEGRAAGIQANERSSFGVNLKTKSNTEADSNRVLGFRAVTDRAKTKAALFAVSGLVVDDEGNPLPSVTVQIKGTSIGMLTDAKGAYQLGSTAVIGSLLFRYLGYRTQEEEVKNRKVINVEMRPDVSTLGEVVVSDYSPPQPPDEEEVVKNYNPARPVYGQKAFTRHVKENLIYPEAAAANDIKGRVLVEFTVTAEGNIKDIKILKGLGHGCDKEAIRLIKTGPKWQARRAGIDRSTPVDSKVKVRIRFKP